MYLEAEYGMTKGLSNIPSIMPSQNEVKNLIGLYCPLDVVTNAKYKLLRFLTNKFFLKTEEGTIF
jgi:hypothetical protein